MPSLCFLLHNSGRKIKRRHHNLKFREGYRTPLRIRQQLPREIYEKEQRIYGNYITSQIRTSHLKNGSSKDAGLSIQWVALPMEA